MKTLGAVKSLMSKGKNRQGLNRCQRALHLDSRFGRQIEILRVGGASKWHTPCFVEGATKWKSAWKRFTPQLPAE